MTGPGEPGPGLPLVVDLADVEVEGPHDVLVAVERLRAQLSTGRRVVVRNCPQMVAHTLYKAGLLLDGRIELESWREEEPYG